MADAETRARRRRRLLAIAVMLALLAVLMVLSLCTGAARISPEDLIAALGGTRDTAAYRILVLVRAPRTAAAALSGAALALSGALIQSVLRNPLGSPNVIGVNSGAGLAVIVFASFMPHHAAWLPAAAFVGALAAMGIVCLLGKLAGAGRHTLILSGVAVNMLFSALTDFVTVAVPDSIYSRAAFRLGGLNAVQPEVLAPAAVCICIAALGAYILRDTADVLSLGDDIAANLGAHVTAMRLLLLTLAAVLAGSGVSFAGLAGFTGLVVPHIARMVFGGRMRALLPACVVGGADLVLLCDIVARTAFAPSEIPVGIMLALIGGPFFVVLLLRHR